MKLVPDDRVDFTAFFVRASTKTELRSFVAHHGLEWVRYQHARGVQGCVVFDIDSTIIDGNDAVKNGFDAMRHLLDEASLLYPVHIVTARPCDQHAHVMRLLRSRGFCIPTDRLHMLPTELYGRSSRHVEEFKWRTHQELVRRHVHVIARFGDMLWDVAHLDALHDYLGHVEDRDCHISFDPALRGTLSSKLPG